MRIVLTVGVFLILAAPAGAQERVCHGQLALQPRPSRRRRVRDFARRRAQFGFRHDLPYVRLLIARGVWEYDVGYIPVTPPRTATWRRDRLELGTKGYRYLHAHKDVAGGVAVEDDWPHAPYLEVGFTRRPRAARARAAARGLVRHPRGRARGRSRFSQDTLEHDAGLVWKDERKALKGAGFLLARQRHRLRDHRRDRRDHAADRRQRVFPQALRRGRGEGERARGRPGRRWSARRRPRGTRSRRTGSA